MNNPTLTQAKYSWVFRPSHAKLFTILSSVLLLLQWRDWWLFGLWSHISRICQHHGWKTNLFILLSGFSLQACMCVHVHGLYLCMFQCPVTACCVFVCFCEHVPSLGKCRSYLNLCVYVWRCVCVCVCLSQPPQATRVFSPLPPTNLATLLATLPCSEWASRPVMFAVNLRKEMIPELDLLIEHLSSSDLISSDCMCVCASSHLW